MSDPLKSYLQDHLAGAMHAIELLKAMRAHHAGERLGEFAAQLLVEIESDRNVLAKLTERLGGSVNGPKEWGAWLAEKLSRVKLRHSGNDLGTFEALEFLVLGIHGKWALWRALSVVRRQPDIDCRPFFERRHGLIPNIHRQRAQYNLSHFTGGLTGAPRSWTGNCPGAPVLNS